MSFISIGVPVSEFSQSDLAANSVMYYHTSPTEEYIDAFTYTVSDGTNEVVFYRSIPKINLSMAPWISMLYM